MTNWLRHWGLARDPFDGRAGSFVATPAHAEAVARLVYTIGSGGRSARLVAGPGLGKSVVLARAIEESRGPTVRIARATGPADGPALIATLAAGLGARVAADAPRSAGWRALAESVRLCRWQGLGVVLAVDECQTLAAGPDRRDLDRLEHLDPDPSARLTVLRVGRPAPGPSEADWGLRIRLEPLTQADSADYLRARLTTAGRSDPTFTPRALARLHALAGGVPRGLDRLATLALMAGAVRGLEIIPPDLVDDASRECSAVEATAPGT